MDELTETNRRAAMIDPDPSRPGASTLPHPVAASLPFPYTEAQVEEGYRRCRDVTRRSARNFYYAFALLPAAQRRSLYAVYRFCRECDDIADGTAPRQQKDRALQRQADLIDQLYAGSGPTGDAEAAALADTIRRYAIPRTYFDDFLLGVRSDISPPRYMSFADLRTYCYRVASVIGLITIEILGYDPRHADDARAAAIDLGLAMQLTNILRDVREDAERGRIYLPEAEWQEYDLSAADIAQGVVEQRFRAFMAFQIRRARAHFNKASRLFAYLPRRARVCPATMSAFYSRILDRIEAFDYDIFRNRAELTGVQKVGLTLLTLGRSWLLSAPRHP